MRVSPTRLTSRSRCMRYSTRSRMEAIRRPCSSANLRRSGMRAIEPSSFMISQMTPAGMQPARRARSTDPSVCPVRTRTPPFLATTGKTCPGRTTSSGRAFGAIAIRMVVARSCAEIPVVTPLRASMETVNAVPNGEELSCTMGGRWSCFARSSVMLRQMSPRPWRAMKLIASGVTCSAAMVRSPSFSRSSSSTRTIIFPARMSSRASSILARVIPPAAFLRKPLFFEEIQGNPASPPFQVSQDIFPDDVRLHVDRVPAAQPPPRRFFQRERDQLDFESFGMDGTYGQADSVQGHGPFENNVFHYRGIGPYMEYPGLARVPYFTDRPGPVDVPVHQVAVQSPGEGKGALQVHPRPGRDRLERRPGKRFRGDIREKPPFLLRDDRKTHPGDREGIPDADLLQGEPRGNAKDDALPAKNHRTDRAEVFHEAGENLPPPA